MRKFRIFYDKDKQQEWLNKMSKEGWSVKKFFCGIYTFEKCEKGEYIYQIDLLERKNSSGFLGFLEESGIEVVYIWDRWVILRKKSCEGPFELYTDAESEIKKYKRIRNLFVSCLLGILFVLSFFIIQIIKMEDLGSKIRYIILILGLYGVSFVGYLSIIRKCISRINSLK